MSLKHTFKNPEDIEHHWYVSTHWGKSFPHPLKGDFHSFLRTTVSCCDVFFGCLPDFFKRNQDAKMCGVHKSESIGRNMFLSKREAVTSNLNQDLFFFFKLKTFLTATLTVAFVPGAADVLCVCVCVIKKHREKGKSSRDLAHHLHRMWFSLPGQWCMKLK